MSEQPTPYRDPLLEERFDRLCRMTAEFLQTMPPAGKDRMMQLHLSAVRGPERNFDLLCKMTASMLRLRKERDHVGNE